MSITESQPPEARKPAVYVMCEPQPLGPEASRNKNKPAAANIHGSLQRGLQHKLCRRTCKEACRATWDTQACQSTGHPIAVISSSPFRNTWHQQQPL
eukprot:1157836-Pelagomonas_calceolata.AAC.11